jgi:hypothetical protein
VTILLVSIIPDATSGSIGVKRIKLSLLTKTSMDAKPLPKITIRVGDAERFTVFSVMSLDLSDLSLTSILFVRMPHL